MTVCAYLIPFCYSDISLDKKKPSFFLCCVVALFVLAFFVGLYALLFTDVCDNFSGTDMLQSTCTCIYG